MTAADRRALGLGAMVVLPVLAWTLVVRPYAGALDAARERLRDERTLLARERQLLSDAPGYPARRQRASAALGTTWGRIVRGPDTLSVAASLATAVTDAAAAAGLLVEQVEAHGADSLRTAALGRVRLGAATVDMRARGDLERVLDFLDALETGETLLHVDRLRIERAASAGEAPDQETLAVLVSVTGIARVLDRPAVAAPPRRSSSSTGSRADGEPADSGRAP